MNWNKVIDHHMLSIHSSCNLAIIGETSDDQPFCFEHHFKVLKLDGLQFEVSLDFGTNNPLSKLKKVCFVELSFRDKGILYFAFVNLLHQDNLKHHCILKLSAPDKLLNHEQRRYVRANIPMRTPINCYIVGLRGQAAQQGVFVKGELIDISGSGLSFVTSSRLFYPLLLQMHISLPNHSNKIQVMGEVLRVTYLNMNTYRVSVEFRNASSETVHEIDQYSIKHYK